VSRTAQKTAAALEIWAEARERAIAELTRKIAALEASGQTTEAHRLRTAAARLHAKLLSERKRASMLRAGLRVDQAPKGPAVDREVA
jgi:HPt (histidine-containing phosphotransfer) domain-containing protein